MPVCPRSAWLGRLSRYDTTGPVIDEGMGDEKWITADLLDFIVSQVRGVASFRYFGNASLTDVLVEHQRIPVLSQPIYELISSFHNVVKYLPGNFHSPLPAHMNEPLPELGDPVEWIVVPSCVYEYVSVQQV